MALVPGEEEVEEAVANFTGGMGADAVIIAAASQDNRPLRLAAGVARERARLVLVGVADLALTRNIFWKKELRVFGFQGRGSGSIAPLYEAKGFDYPIALVRWTERRNLEACLDLIAQGHVRVQQLITHRFPIQEALSAYELILANREPYIGVMLSYPQGELAAAPGRTVRLAPAVPGSGPPRPGAGPDRRGHVHQKPPAAGAHQVGGVPLVGVATTTGATAAHIANKFRFAYATTDYQELLGIRPLTG